MQITGSLLFLDLGKGICGRYIYQYGLKIKDLNNTYFGENTKEFGTWN